MALPYQNILLPVDGSQQSIDAFKQGIALAKGMDVSVFLVQVLSEDTKDTNIEKRESFLDALEKYALDQGVSLQKELVYGDPRTQIAEELVERLNIDLIIIGATGKGRIAKMVVGSVTTYVVRNATCAVLISR